MQYLHLSPFAVKASHSDNSHYEHDKLQFDVQYKVRFCKNFWKYNLKKICFRAYFCVNIFREQQKTPQLISAFTTSCRQVKEKSEKQHWKIWHQNFREMKHKALFLRVSYPQRLPTGPYYLSCAVRHELNSLWQPRGSQL